MCRFLVLVLICAAVSVAHVQQTQNAPLSPPKISVDVKLVLIPATVRDKHGSNVPNLNKDDFVLHVDGHLRAISNVIPESDLPLTLGLLVQTSLGPNARYARGNESDANYGFLNHMLPEDKDKAFVITFGHKVELLQGLTSSRPKLRAALQLIQTTELSGGGHAGGTRLYDAICLASNQMMKTQQGHKALFVLSDEGKDRGSGKTQEDAVEAAQRADVSVYPILVTDYWPVPKGKKVLKRISTETGGRMFKISHKRTVAQIYAEAEEELRNQYVLGYTPTGADASAGYHKIHLTMKKKGLTVKARDGYYSDQ